MNGTERTMTERTERRVDLISLVAGLVALCVAANTLLGGVSWLPGVDARWVLASTAILLGLLLLIGSLRPRRS